jgi:cobalt-zinc-cadmium efflux system protein
MSTTETALTVHLVMPSPPATDKFLDKVCHELREHFRVDHITVQIEHGDEACHQAPSHVV